MAADRFPTYYILNNRVPFAVDFMMWAKFFENIDNRRVAYTVVDESLGVTVSTVFLGLDHNWGGGEPILFETMAFGPSARSLISRSSVDNDHDEMQTRRYCTWAQAEKGHAEVVAEMTALVERVKAQSAGVLGVKIDGR